MKWSEILLGFELYWNTVSITLGTINCTRIGSVDPKQDMKSSILS